MSQFHFDQKIQELEQAFAQEIPKEVAEQTRDYFINAFDSKSWDGNQWEPDKEPTDDQGVKTGALRDALMDSIKVSEDGKVEISIDLDYAAYFNDGTDRIPARQFVGDTEELSKIQQNIIHENITRIL